MTDGYEFVVYFGTNRFYANGTVYGKSKIECSRTHGQHFYITLWCVHIDFFGEKTGFEILQEVDTVCLLAGDHFADLLKPFIEAAFIGRSFFIFPVSSETFFRDLVHPFRANL